MPSIYILLWDIMNIEIHKYRSDLGITNRKSYIKNRFLILNTYRTVLIGIKLVFDQTQMIRSYHPNCHNLGI